MVLTLAIPIRAYYKLEHLITMKHIDNMAKIMLATGLIVAYGYGMEAFFGWYSANPYERFMLWNRMTGPYGWSYWLLIFINAVLIHVLWFKSVRYNLKYMFVLSLIVNLAMWLHDVRRHDGPLHHAVLPVHEVRAHDFDLRSAHAAAGSQGARAARTRHPRLGPLGGISSHARQQRHNRALRADGRIRLGAEHR
jgi:hypothetical protein